MSPIHDPRYSAVRPAYADDSTTRSAYLQPLYLAAGGAVLIFLYLAMMGGGAVAAIGLPIVLLAVGIRVVLGIVALFIAMAVLGSGAGTLGLGILRLFGIFTFVTGVAFFVSPLACIGVIMTVLVLAGLIAWQFELDGSEALIVVLVMAAVEVAATFLLSALAGSMG